ncbi:MAG TPA: hypothetical protein VFV38_25540 [Ktedonobacteraceae bacterium]|nr:hypothetical protein [Ktedonobacteraceae bacterium]
MIWSSIAQNETIPLASGHCSRGFHLSTGVTTSIGLFATTWLLRM